MLFSMLLIGKNWCTYNTFIKKPQANFNLRFFLDMTIIIFKY